MVASRREGLEELREAIAEAALRGERPPPPVVLDEALEADVREIEAVVDDTLAPASPAARRAWALFCLLSLGDDELVGIPEALREAAVRVRARAEAAGRDLDLEIIGTRYAASTRSPTRLCAALGARARVGPSASTPC